MKSLLLPDCLNRWLRSLSALTDFPTVLSDVAPAVIAAFGGVNVADFGASLTGLRP